MRMHTPIGSLVLDRSIRDGDLARSFVKVNRAMQLSLLALSDYVSDHDVTARTLFFPVTSKLRLAFITVSLHSSLKNT